MQRFCEKEARKLNKLKYILFDVDDTVTNGGKLLAMRDEDSPYYYLTGGRQSLCRHVEAEGTRV